MNLKHPIVFSVIGGLIIYIVLFLDRKRKNTMELARAKISKRPPQIDNTNISLKLPLIVCILIWGTASFFNSNNIEDNNDIFSGNNETINQIIFTDQPNF